MASSRQIAAGEDYTPDDINNLRADVLDPVGGHKHNGVDGAKVPFSNLDVSGASGSTAPAGGSKSYTQIADHVAGSQGVHGLAATSYVAGGMTAGTLIQTGYVAQAVAAGGLHTGAVTFPVAFSAAPHMNATVHHGSGPATYQNVTLTNVTTTGFTWVLSTNPANNVATSQGFWWFAVGVKT